MTTRCKAGLGTNTTAPRHTLRVRAATLPPPQDVTDDDLQSAVQSDGSTVYTASVTGPDGGVYTDTHTKPADGHHHTKGTKHDAQPATCTQAGVAEYWDCEANDGTKLNAAGEAVTDAQLAISALGHTYTVNGALEWKETSSYTTAILHLVCGVCQDGAGHTLDVELTAKQTTSDASKCGATGSITYTVSVEDTDNAAAITAAVVAPNKLAQGALDSVEPLTHTDNNAQRGHDWKLAQESAFDWTGTTKDSASVKVKYVCQTCRKEITITFTDAVGTPTPATCTAAGHVEYTLTKSAEQVKAAAQSAPHTDFELYATDLFQEITAQTHTADGDPATGHTWQVTAVDWAQEYNAETHATVTVACSVCSETYNGGDPEVSFTENKQDPECEVEGSVTYTLTVKVGGAELGFVDEADKTSSAYTIPALGHERDDGKYHALQDSTCTAPGTKEYWGCKRCDANLNAAGEEIDDITIAAKNHLYTTQYTNDGCSDGFHKRVCDRCSVAEEEPTACTPDAGDETHDHTHQLAEGWYADGDYHWKKCELCGKEYGKERHDYQEYSSEVCVDCGHVHMDVEVSTNDDGSEPQHFNSVKEAFEWIAEQADKTKTYKIRLNHNRTSDDAENLTVSDGHKVVLDLESYSLTLNGGKLTVTGEGSSLEVTGTGALNATVYYESGTLKLPENLLDKLKLGEDVKCKGENVHITIGDAALEHKWLQDNSFTDDSGHYQVCERCGEQNTLVEHHLEWVKDAQNHHQKCKDCGYTTEPVSHVEELKWVTTPTHHHQECETCGYKSDDVAHSFTYPQKDEEDCHEITCTVCHFDGGTENCSASLGYDDVCTKCKKDYREEVTIHWHKDESFTNAYLWAWYLNPTSHDVFDSVDNPARLMTADSVGGAGWVSITVKYPRNTERHLKFTDKLYWNDGVTITDCQETSNTSSEKNDIWCSKAGKAFDSKEEALADEKIDPPAETDWIVVGDNNGWATDTTTWDNAFGMKNGVMQDTVEIKFTANQGFKFKENKSGWSCEQIDCNGAWIVTGAESGTGNLHSLFSSTSDGNIKVLKACTLRFTFDATYKCVKIHVVSVTNATGTCTYSYGIIGSRDGFSSDWAAGTSHSNGIFTWSNIAFQASESWKIRRGQAWTNSNGYNDVKIVTSNAGVGTLKVTQDGDNIKMPSGVHNADVVFNSFNGHIWINFTK